MTHRFNTLIVPFTKDKTREIGDAEARARSAIADIIASIGKIREEDIVEIADVLEKASAIAENKLSMLRKK